MKLEERIKQAIIEQIIQTGYEDRMNKIAENGMDDYAGIDYTDVVASGMEADGSLTKQAADETIIREIRRQIVSAGYNYAKSN